MGSIPGVVLGAIFLIGLPELFREFSEYRFLFYGAALILMMRFRPEGLLPSRVVQRELHVEEENVEPAENPVGTAVAARTQAQTGTEREPTVAEARSADPATESNAGDDATSRYPADATELELDARHRATDDRS